MAFTVAATSGARIPRGDAASRADIRALMSLSALKMASVAGALAPASTCEVRVHPAERSAASVPAAEAEGTRSGVGTGVGKEPSDEDEPGIVDRSDNSKVKSQEAEVVADEDRQKTAWHPAGGSLYTDHDQYGSGDLG